MYTSYSNIIELLSNYRNPCEHDTPR